ncbi:MAG: hypothetical protein MUP22_09650, partial [Desulfobacterales bacterium]|nr:hypothetical protein [Desulfobacterales bacterium]
LRRPVKYATLGTSFISPGRQRARRIFVRIGCAGKEPPAVNSDKDAMPAAVLLLTPVKCS